MTFISYAQNFEDVILWRALSHIKSGFYVDLGAWSPDTHSVTKAFYDNGWSGVNVEPHPDMARELRVHRPRDQNLEMAVAEIDGFAEMSFIGDTGLSTLDSDVARSHQNSHPTTSRAVVPVLSLITLWEKYIVAGQQVHFLKIDIEGSEKAAIAGNDWKINRPWVLVVEATVPMSQAPSYADWEPILFEANYVFVYNDGINRFYAAQERSEIMSSFGNPPTVFDGFTLVSEVEAESRAVKAESRAMAAESRVVEAESRAMEAESRVVEAESRAMEAGSRAMEAESRVMEAGSRAVEAESRVMEAESRAVEAESALSSTHESRSWRWTAPSREALVLSRKAKVVLSRLMGRRL
jgi:FkbM family methyltransferase